MKGEPIDLWYSGKAHEHGGNIQALTAPDGFPLWVCDVEPGSVHDLTAAREHVLDALYWAASRLDLPTLADSGYDGAGIGVFTPVKQPADRRALDVDNRTYTPCCAACAASENEGSPCSPDDGAPYDTSPPAHARSATSSKPPSCSLISSTDDSPETH